MTASTTMVTTRPQTTGLSAARSAIVAATGINSAMQAARLVIARWMSATAAMRPTISRLGSLARPARWETMDWLTKAAAPDLVMAAASDSAAPMLRIKPHDNLFSNVFHD